MREALQRQIDEKQRKKDAEKQMLKMQEMRDEQRVKRDLKEMAHAEGMPAAASDLEDPQQTINHTNVEDPNGQG